jgi:hypothetical protein
MYMRMAWGLGVGHTYSHDPATMSTIMPELPNDSDIIMEDVIGGEESGSSERMVDADFRVETNFHFEDGEEETQIRGDDFTYSLLPVAEDEDEDEDEDFNIGLEAESEDAGSGSESDREDAIIFGIL